MGNKVVAKRPHTSQSLINKESQDCVAIMTGDCNLPNVMCYMPTEEQKQEENKQEVVYHSTPIENQEGIKNGRNFGRETGNLKTLSTQDAGFFANEPDCQLVQDQFYETTEIQVTQQEKASPNFKAHSNEINSFMNRPTDVSTQQQTFVAVQKGAVFKYPNKDSRNQLIRDQSEPPHMPMNIINQEETFQSEVSMQNPNTSSRFRTNKLNGQIEYLVNRITQPTTASATKYRQITADSKDGSRLISTKKLGHQKSDSALKRKHKGDLRQKNKQQQDLWGKVSEFNKRKNSHKTHYESPRNNILEELQLTKAQMDQIQANRRALKISKQAQTARSKVKDHINPNFRELNKYRDGVQRKSQQQLNSLMKQVRQEFFQTEDSITNKSESIINRVKGIDKPYKPVDRSGISLVNVSRPNYISHRYSISNLQTASHFNKEFKLNYKRVASASTQNLTMKKQPSISKRSFSIRSEKPLAMETKINKIFNFKRPQDFAQSKRKRSGENGGDRSENQLHKNDLDNGGSVRADDQCINITNQKSQTSNQNRVTDYKKTTPSKKSRKRLEQLNEQSDPNVFQQCSPISSKPEELIFEYETPALASNDKDKKKPKQQLPVKQGVVYRYKPTFKKTPMFVERYLELHNDVLQYKMTGQRKKNCLFTIPLREVDQVQRLKTTQKGEMSLFEVCLRTNFESLHYVNQVQGYIRNSMELDVNPRSKNRQSFGEEMQGKSIPNIGRVMPTNQSADFFDHIGREQFQLRKNNISAQVDISHSPEKHSKITVKQINLSPTRRSFVNNVNQSQGLSTVNRSLAQSVRKKLNANYYTRSVSPRKSRWLSNQRVNRVVQGHGIVVPQSTRPLNDSSIDCTLQPFSINDSKGINLDSYEAKNNEISRFYPKSMPPPVVRQRNLKWFSWTKRLHDFYEAETRFVFACPTDKEVISWIDKIEEVRSNIISFKV